jgi:hypothetical protein
MRTNEGLTAAPNMQNPKPKTLVAQEFQTTIVGMLGHDLRQSLQIIEGTYALLRSRLNEMPQQAWLDRGELAITKLAEQLDCLVDAFYLAERDHTLEFSYVRLGPLFWRLRHENEDAALQRGIDLRAVSTNAHVVSNPILLSCILRNADQCHKVHGARRARPDWLPSQRARNEDRCVRHGYRHSGRPIAKNLRILHAPRARTRPRFGHRALYRLPRDRGAWSPDRSSIGRWRRVTLLDLRAPCIDERKLRWWHNWHFCAVRSCIKWPQARFRYFQLRIS